MFLDFEATETSQEIISIGAIKAELDNKKHIKSYDDGFQCYIKTSTIITPIIENITGITNKLLDEKGIPFPLAISKLENYIGQNLNQTHFMTFGNYDMRLLHVNSVKYNLKENNLILHIFRKNTDFSQVIHQFMRNENNQTLSLVNSLKIFNLRPAKPLHNSLSDAKSLMFLYEAFLSNKKIIRNEYLKVIKNAPHLPNPVRKLINKVVEDEQATLDDLFQYIDEDLK